MREELEDNQWVDEVLNGKTDSYVFLVDKYKDRLFSLAIGLLKQKEDAEEAAQDVFVKVYKALPKFQRKAKFSTWIYRITYNECISRLRKQKFQVVSTDGTQISNLSTVQDDSENWQNVELRSRLLHQSLDKLPETDRGLVHLFYFEDLPIEEIARITGLSVSNVKIKLFRIRKKLYSELSASFKSSILEHQN